MTATMIPEAPPKPLCAFCKSVLKSPDQCAKCKAMQPIPFLSRAAMTPEQCAADDRNQVVEKRLHEIRDRDGALFAEQRRSGDDSRKRRAIQKEREALDAERIDLELEQQNTLHPLLLSALCNGLADGCGDRLANPAGYFSIR